MRLTSPGCTLRSRSLFLRQQKKKERKCWRAFLSLCSSHFCSQCVVRCAPLLLVQLTYQTEGAYFTCTSCSLTPPGNTSSAAPRRWTGAASTSLSPIFRLIDLSSCFCHLMNVLLQWQQVSNTDFPDRGTVFCLSAAILGQLYWQTYFFSFKIGRACLFVYLCLEHRSKPSLLENLVHLTPVNDVSTHILLILRENKKRCKSRPTVLIKTITNGFVHTAVGYLKMSKVKLHKNTLYYIIKGR